MNRRFRRSDERIDQLYHMLYCAQINNDWLEVEKVMKQLEKYQKEDEELVREENSRSARVFVPETD